MLPELTVLGVAPAGLVTLEVETVGAGLLQLRVAPTLGDAQLGAGFHHLQAGNLQAGVVGVGFADQAVEGRVVEHPPPLADIGLCRRLAGLLDGRTAPLLEPGLARWLKIRPQAHAAAQAEGAEQQEIAWET
ncbi:hypothetical protein D9M68_787070 [compost metagenome]